MANTKDTRKANNPNGSPLLGENGLLVEKGDNAKFIKVNMELFQMPNIDLNDLEQVKQRLYDYYDLYFRNDMKPTVAGMALALNGKDRQWLWAVTHDRPYNGSAQLVHIPKDVADIIKKAYKMLENLWESYMNSGKINPVSGIFLGKNHYNYRDKTEYVVTPNVQQDSDFDAAAIRQRYLTDEAQEAAELTDSSTDGKDGKNGEE